MDLKLRRFRDSDNERLTELCNNKNIWDNLRDCIPYPYTSKDGAGFIALCQTEDPQTTFAIEFNGEFVGTIGLVRQSDIYSLTAEIGYWIGEPYWGLGIATNAVNQIVTYGFIHLNLVRIYAGVFESNKASQKVLEKAGFKLDCIFEKSVCKNGNICNEWRFSVIKK
ncbi:MAG: GNAT family N-acetyltransferase [Bacteroidetes bacterium]|nr:GNAT family N-acetyltransferase [Bacteroidota bacterium]